MGRVREIPRAAAFAWSPGAAPPWIATGTKAGAIDADFSNDTQLEIWDLGLDNTDQGSELQPTGSVSTDSRLARNNYHCILRACLLNWRTLKVL